MAVDSAGSLRLTRPTTDQETITITKGFADTWHLAFKTRQNNLEAEVCHHKKSRPMVMIKQFRDIVIRYSVNSNVYLFVASVWAGAVFILSVIPPLGEDPVNAGISAHGIAYFVLAFLFGLYLIVLKTGSPFIKAVVISGSYGAFIEVVQYMIPYRSFAVSDIAVNFLSSLIGTAVLWGVVKRTQFFENLYKQS